LRNMQKTIASLLLVLTLATGLPLVVSGCQSDAARAAENIVKINTLSQESNGVTVVNYQVVIKTSVNWDTLSDSGRQALVDAGISQSQALAQQNNVFNYNVIAIDEAGTVLYHFDREHNVAIIYIGGQATDQTLPAPAAQ